jgi:hypothetical protein
MEHANDFAILFKIAQPEGEFIIGPSSFESLQDLFILEKYAVRRPGRAAQQAHMDLLSSTSYVSLHRSYHLVDRSRSCHVLRELAWAVLLDASNMGGLCGPLPRDVRLKLPSIRPGYWTRFVGQLPMHKSLLVQRANILYAKDHHAFRDLT